LESLPGFTTRAKVFIGGIAVAGIAMLSVGVYRWSSGNILRFFAYLALSLMASTLKVRLPRSESTISASFLFVLIGISSFTLSETLAIGCSAALMQTFWKPKQYIAVQGFFNLGSWAVSITLSYWLSHFLIGPSQPLTILLPLATFLFFGSHVGLAALAIALTTQKSFAETWQSCFLWSFPYYLFGAIVAGLCSISARTAVWWPPVLVLPLMYLTHLFYSTCVDRLRGANA
jgi:hypothetical protein